MTSTALEFFNLGNAKCLTCKAAFGTLDKVLSGETFAKMILA